MQLENGMNVSILNKIIGGIKMDYFKGIQEYGVGEVFTGIVLVSNANVATARNGNPYINVTVGDSTGSVSSMIWDSTEEKEMIFRTGNIIKIQGVVGEYQGNKQINIQHYRLTTESDQVNLSNLVESAPMEGEVLFKLIRLEAFEMKNEKIKQVVVHILDKYKNDFILHPAAKSVHHYYLHGLAYHTYSMMNIAKMLSDLYPVLNKDLLVAGTILHDIGKIKEYEYENYVADFSLEGKLKGHISIMSEEIGAIANELNIKGEEVLLLQHMLLSHHGLQQNGWGSAVSPLILEANVLHQIDMIDAGIDAFKNAIKNVEKGEFTGKVFGLDNRSFYNHKL